MIEGDGERCVDRDALLDLGRWPRPRRTRRSRVRNAARAGVRQRPAGGRERARADGDRVVRRRRPVLGRDDRHARCRRRSTGARHAVGGFDGQRRLDRCALHRRAEPDRRRASELEVRARRPSGTPPGSAGTMSVGGEAVVRRRAGRSDDRSERRGPRRGRSRRRRARTVSGRRSDAAYTPSRTGTARIARRYFRNTEPGCSPGERRGWGSAHGRPHRAGARCAGQGSTGCPGPGNRTGPASSGSRPERGLLAERAYRPVGSDRERPLARPRRSSSVSAARTVATGRSVVATSSSTVAWPSTRPRATAASVRPRSCDVAAARASRHPAAAAPRVAEVGDELRDARPRCGRPPGIRAGTPDSRLTPAVDRAGHEEARPTLLERPGRRDERPGLRPAPRRRPSRRSAR